MKRRLPHRSPPFLAFAAATLALIAGDVHADVLGGGVRPAEPNVCDSVWLFVDGATPSSCYKVLGMRVGEPQLLDTMGPIPTYRIVAQVLVQDQDLAIDPPCAQVIEPYRLSKPLGRLSFGTYLVEAIERVETMVDPATPTPTPVFESSRINFSFHVAPDTCRTGLECVLLGFEPSDLGGMRVDPCTARTPGGERVCFDVTLWNPVPVAGVQTEILLDPPRQGSDGRSFFHPARVAAAPRASGFEASWTAEGTTVKAILFSTSGAVLSAGRGPILHVCYDVDAGVPANAYPLHFGSTIVATPRGEALPYCPTFAEIEGRICVGESTCDVNGDGAGDIRDLVRIVRCALTAPSDTNTACPDSIRARADCTGDGSVDVRDVICCARRILALNGGWSSEPPAGGTSSESPARIGFDGAVRWTSPLEGEATVRVEPGSSFGGIQWLIDPGEAARVADVRLDDPLGLYAVAWSEAANGTARVVLYDRGFIESGSAEGAPAVTASGIPVRIALEPRAGAASGGTVRLLQWRSANGAGDALATTPAAVEAVVPANAAAGAPAILPARPNPFVSGTEIAYSLPAAGRVSMRIFDVAGRSVRTLVSGSVEAGVHRVTWDGRDARGRGVGNGIYFVRLDAAGVTMTQRLMRLR